VFYFKAVLWESIILLLRPFPPLCKAYPIALLLSSPLPVFLANRRASLFFRTATHSSSGPSQLSPTGIHPPPLYFRTGARVCSSVPQPKGHTGGGGYPSPVLTPPPSCISQAREFVLPYRNPQLERAKQVVLDRSAKERDRWTAVWGRDAIVSTLPNTC